MIVSASYKTDIPAFYGAWFEARLAEARVPLVDAYELFEQHSRSGILDDQFLADHVHPTVFGHQLLAAELYEEMVAMGVTEFPDDLANRLV